MSTVSSPLALWQRVRCTAWASGSVILFFATAAAGATVAEMAKETGCITRPQQVAGAAMYKCETRSGVQAFFNAEGTPGPAETPRRSTTPAPAAGVARVAPTPGFPRVDPETQKGRDDVRRRVLQDELAAEEKLLNEARATYSDGAPTPLPEERNNTDKYRERISRLRQAVALHERNIEALRKEIGGLH